MDPTELVVDLDVFRRTAPLVRPRLIPLGASLTYFRSRSGNEHDCGRTGWQALFDGTHQIAAAVSFKTVYVKARW